MLFSVEQAFVGREEIRAPLKTPAWEAICQLAYTKLNQLEYSFSCQRGILALRASLTI